MGERARVRRTNVRQYGARSRPPDAGAARDRSPRLRGIWIRGVLAVVIGCSLGCDDGGPPPEEPGRPVPSASIPASTSTASTVKTRRDGAAETGADAAPAGFVGSARCTGCHAEAGRAWRGSHHDLAMAGPESVVGDFGAAPLERAGERWGFEREGEAYFVRHEDAQGRVDRRRVVASFGIAPLQQVLVEGAGGRLHAWPIAWDARPEAEGGQRWLSLIEDEVAPPPEDPLHRDGPAYEWNSQCAACHSTALHKGYDEVTHTYDTRQAAIDVACEACHGPGARHAERAASGRPSAEALVVRFEPWRPGVWRREAGMRIAARTAPRGRDQQLEVCAPCHARRATLQDPPRIGAPFLDGHAPRLIEPGLYYEDGGIDDEVYVWGSFLQSRMAAAGVRCSDCHDPHSLAPRRPGQRPCARDATRPRPFDGPSHRGHPRSEPASVERAPDPSGTGRACIDCHMPTRTYMEVDVRRDHAFPMPRPARSAALGTPDPCLACHGERDASWATAAIARWRGDRPAKPHWSDRLVSDGRARPAALAWLEIAGAPESPDLVRGSAWRRLADVPAAPPPASLLADRVRVGGPLERLGLVDLARRYSGATRARLLAPLLQDERRAIRVAAAEGLAEAGGDALRPADRSSLGRALRELRAVLAANAERPGSEDPTGAARSALRRRRGGARDPRSRDRARAVLRSGAGEPGGPRARRGGRGDGPLPARGGRSTSRRRTRGCEGLMASPCIARGIGRERSWS